MEELAGKFSSALLETCLAMLSNLLNPTIFPFELGLVKIIDWLIELRVWGKGLFWLFYAGSLLGKLKLLTWNGTLGETGKCVLLGKKVEAVISLFRFVS